ncbi:MAG: hypothetical protein E7661_09185 [Ruminococcaceae bacterium]|nr:hypothetical protein [Oscillospiraceae bacterium]
MAEHMAYCIGIDGGGTKTEGVLTDISGHVLCIKKYGASNPNDVGLEASAELLSHLISDLLTDGGHICPQKVSVFAGVAGALQQKEKLTYMLRSNHPHLGGLSVHSDVINLLSASSESGEGVCLICGTGSVCFVRRGNELRRIGGWGYLLDRAGGGYDIGRMAIETVLRAHDGREDRDACAPLTRAITEHLGEAPQHMLSEIYAQGKPLIASCAIPVFDLARKGDPMAMRILKINAEAQAECIAAALEDKLHDADGHETVVLGGSICVKESGLWTELITAHLPKRVRALVELKVIDVPPVFGALAEALAMIPGVDRAACFDVYKREFLSSYLS